MDKNTTVIKDIFTKKFISSFFHTGDGPIVKEENGVFTIAARVFDKYVARKYLGSESKVAALFNQVSFFGIKFNKFFKFEVIKLLEEIVKGNERYGVKVPEAKEALAVLKPTIEEKDVMAKFDRNHLEAVMDFKVLPHQEAPLKNYMEYKEVLGYRGMLLHGEIGTGKAQPLDAKILTPVGWKAMGDITTDDTVATVDGSFTKVVGVFPQGSKAIYRITFEDGRSTRCCLEHLWTIRKYEEEELKEEVVTTQDLITHISNHGTENIFIPLPEPIKYDAAIVDISPYLLGVILSSSSLDSNIISINCKDEYILTKVKTILNGDYLIEKNSDSFSILDKDGKLLSPLSESLSKLGLMGLKSNYYSIPQSYLKGSIQQRFDLLKGMLDANGVVISTEEKTFVEYTTTSERMQKDITTLVRSLGGICKLATKSVNSNNENVYTLQIKFPNIVSCISTPALLSRLPKDSKNLKHNILGIKEIVYDREEEAQCIKVEHSSSLYITDEYIVTHNTATSLFIMEGLHNEVDKVVVLCPLPTVDRVWKSSISGDKGARVFKETQGIYLVKDNKEYNNEKYIVSHFEGIEKVFSILDKLPKGRVGIIVDESHYLNEIKSKRTQLALELIEETESDNILLLSGTPIKAGYRELGNIFKFLDKSFNKDSEERYYKLYKNPSNWLGNVLKERYSLYNTVVKKDSVKISNLETVNLKIKLPDEVMEPFYLSNISKRLKEYISKRLEEIKSNMDYWIDQYHILRDKGVNNNPSMDKKEVTFYMNNIEVIRKTSPFNFGRIKDILAYCNKYEKEQIIPYLTPEEGKIFTEAKTIYKYPLLKVQGEALANIIGQARIDCHAIMAEYLDYDKILQATNKKTIIFSNYIEVCERVMNVLKKNKYNPIGVYGEHTKNLSQLVQQFVNDPKTNPIVTTYKSLSTGVPLTVADRVICIDMPFRMYVYEQAIGRAWRLGQDSDVTVFILELDTDTPNINSRNIDIITYFKEEVEKITGIPSNISLTSESKDDIISTESFYSNTIEDMNAEISLEASKSPKRRQVEDYILKYISKIVSGDYNTKLYRDLFNSMSDKEFDEYMVKLKNKEITLSVIIPNGSKEITTDINNNIKIGKELGFDFFQPLHFGKDGDLPAYTTPNKYMVMKLPIKRAAQLLDKKISIAKDSNEISSLTGQVSGESKASKLSGPEIQVLIGIGCNNSLVELLKIRGGDLGAGNAMEQMLIQSGHASQENVNRFSTGVKSTETLRNYFIGAHINSTL